MKYRNYVKITLYMGVLFYTMLIGVLYHLEKNYPLHAFNSISWDTKIHFLKNYQAIDTVDTVIIGSSMGLNNLHGVKLENDSKKVQKVLNLSAWSLKCDHLERVLFQLFAQGKVARIIYLAQYFDYTWTYEIKGPSADIIVGYIKGKPLETLLYVLSSSGNLLNMLNNILHWVKYTNPHIYEYLVFDRTGGNQLDIGQHNANPRRWERIEQFTLRPFEEASMQCLDRITEKAQQQAINFYFVTQPFRKTLFDNHQELSNIITQFNFRTKEIILKYQGIHLDLHQLMNLDDSYFADKSHLNIKGSNATASVLAEIIDRGGNPQKH